MIDRFKLMQLYGVKLRTDARALLAVVTKVTVGSLDGLITIEVNDHDPKRAADMANAYVEEFARLTSGLAITEAQQRRAFFEKQLQAAQKNLAKAQLALGEVGVPESLIKSSPGTVLESIARLRAQVTAQEIKLSTMRGSVTEQNPDFQLAQRELDSMRAQLVQTERSQPKGDTQRDEYLNRFREFKYQEALFELLTKQYESARLDEAREGSIVQVVDAAVPPESRSSPKRAQIAVLTTLATGILLLLLVFAREAFRGARNDPESASKLARIESRLRGLVPGARK
jgi:tyrosine-protein kinase Etk/Wzc